jgi:acyl carrier protein
MNRTDIEARVLRTVALQMGVSEKTLALETTFVADLGADSLDSIELCISLEDEFGLEIPDDEAELITNSAQVVDWIVKHERA